MQKTIPVTEEPRTVRIGRIAESETVSFLAEELSEGGCGCLIVNTVYKAQRMAQALREALPDYEVLLFHSQFLFPDRAEREKKLIERVGKHSRPETRNRLIVVGTQVLEQSLDLDFDVMISELCPMDLLLQRIGRLQRHRQLDNCRPERLKNARCMVLTEENGELDAGSAKVYGEWLLLRTAALLPDEIVLPNDIPTLVQDAYEEPKGELEKTLEKAWQNQNQKERMQVKRARDYCIEPPEEFDEDFPQDSLISGWLDSDVGNDPRAEAAVRDGDPSIDVIVMQRYNNGEVHFLPWQCGGKCVAWDAVPSEEEAREIASQKLRLPRRFCTFYAIEKTIGELERITAAVAEWQVSPLLKGELFLLLDEQCTATLCGYDLKYSRENGLLTEKKEGADDRT